MRREAARPGAASVSGAAPRWRALVIALLFAGAAATAALERGLFREETQGAAGAAHGTPGAAGAAPGIGGGADKRRRNAKATGKTWRDSQKDRLEVVREDRRDAAAPVLEDLSISSPSMPEYKAARDSLCHIVQDEAVCSKVHAEVLPPEAYYDRLGTILMERFPQADPHLVDHGLACCCVRYGSGVCDQLRY